MSINSMFLIRFFIMDNKKENNIIREITPLSDKDCFYIADRYKTEFTYPIHCHKEYELNFIEHGVGLSRIVGDSKESVGEYDLILITSPDLEHVWEQGECKSDNIHEITIQFSPAFLSGLINKNQFERVEKMLNKARNGLCFPMPAILKVYNLISELSTEKGFYAVIKFMTLLYELSLFMDDAKELSSSSFAQIEVQSDSRRILRVQKYIAEHYQDEIHLSQLANMVGMANVSFSRFFKLRTGKSLSDYIIDVRLGYAARLLVDSTMSISEVCYSCGFNNLSNFNRLFKKKRKCTPKEFRDDYNNRRIVI